MGNLCDCFGLRKDESAGGGDERDRLLHDPTEVPADGNSLAGEDTGVLQRDTRDYGSLNGAGDGVNGLSGRNGGANGGLARQESSAWNKTLEKMASDVIDVSAFDGASNTISDGEWMERSRVYAHKVASSRVGSILKASGRPPPPAKQADLKRAIDAAFRPTDESDLALIHEVSEAAVRAVRDGFVVRSTEPLVVQFDP